jgi:hypothetical protein
VRKVALAAAALVAAIVCALAALDLRAWEQALARGEAAGTRLPGDPAGRALGASEDLELRRALRLYRVALRTPRGFDNGETQARARAAAAAALGSVAARGDGPAASQAANLIGVLLEAGGAEQGGGASFEAAVRADTTNLDPKVNLELVLRRARDVGVREGASSGAGQRGEARRGAGAGAPGEGY